MVVLVSFLTYNNIKQEQTFKKKQMVSGALKGV